MKNTKNNRGFTLIEMMIVLAISALMLSVLLISYNVISNANVQKSARRLENVLRSARTRCMTRGVKKGEVTLYEQNGNIYALIGDDTRPTLICNSGVKMEYLATTTYSARAGAAPVPPLASAIKLSFSTSGTVNTFAGNPPNKFILTRDHRCFEVIVYYETGSIETNMYTQ
ncbi:MAG: type II secretion system GspH family protein [Lachnospiraceae bacterium]|nr:type II secretion system GspH family protein [Lachnospiraceae bacterium]